MGGRWIILGGAVLGGLAIAGAARGADLIEPWEPGPSDLELFATFERDARPALSTLVGFGLGGGLSAGLSLAGGGEDPADVGLVLVWTRPLGAWGELDLFAEASSAARELELSGAGTAYGFEWSAAGAAARPYLRLHVADDDGGWRVHPLLGWNLPFERVDLHLEVSSEQPAPGGDWPLHLAVGPNLALGEGLELVPELSLLLSGGGVDAGLTVGVVTSPRALRAAFGGGRRR